MGLQDDPSLDLEVEAEGVPLRLVARLLELDIPVRGRIGEGTQLTVQGSVRRPSAAGTVHLQGLSAEGVALGSGPLEVTSEDLPSQGPLAAHRELRVTGELTAPGPTEGGLQWTVDAVVALGETARGRRQASEFPPVDAEIDVRFDRIALDTLLSGLLRDTQSDTPITGRLDQLRAHVLTCDPASAMLTDCLAQTRTDRSLEVSLQMDEAWIGGHEPTTTDPCQDPTILCAPEEYTDASGRTRDNELQASIDWPTITLDRPWRWTTGGPNPAQLILSGNVDLSTPPPTAAADPADTRRAGCEPPPLDDLAVAPITPGAAPRRDPRSARHGGDRRTAGLRGPRTRPRPPRRGSGPPRARRRRGGLGADHAARGHRPGPGGAIARRRRPGFPGGGRRPRPADR